MVQVWEPLEIHRAAAKKAIYLLWLCNFHRESPFVRTDPDSKLGSQRSDWSAVISPIASTVFQRQVLRKLVICAYAILWNMVGVSQRWGGNAASAFLGRLIPSCVSGVWFLP